MNAVVPARAEEDKAPFVPLMDWLLAACCTRRQKSQKSVVAQNCRALADMTPHMRSWCIERLSNTLLKLDDNEEGGMGGFPDRHAVREAGLAVHRHEIPPSQTQDLTAETTDGAPARVTGTAGQVVEPNTTGTTTPALA